MKIKVLSREKFEEFNSDISFIAISITDPNSESVDTDKKNLVDILSLQFHDIDKPLINQKDCKRCNGTGYLPEYKDINDGHCYACTDKMDIIPFTKRDADDILIFVEKYKNDIDLIVIHCEAGISRSAGVASALSLIYNRTDQYFFDNYIPNRLVYRTILNMYHSIENYD